MPELGKFSGSKPLSTIFLIAYFSAVVVGLVLYAGVYEWEVPRLEISRGRIALLIGAVLLGLLSRSILALNWHRMLAEFPQNQRARLMDHFTVFATAWLGRYLPGKVAPIVFRAAKSELLSTARSHVVITSLVETLLQIAVYSCVSIVAVLVFPDLRVQLGLSIIALVSVALGILVVTWTPVLTWLVRLASKLKSLPTLDMRDLPSFVSNLKTVGSAGIVTVLNGGGLYLIVMGTNPGEIDAVTLSLAIGIAAVASVASLLAVFAPGGVGVVEFVIITGLVMANVDQSSALSVALLWRLVSIVTDVLFWLGPQSVSVAINRQFRL